MGDYLWRLALVLPLILLAIVAMLFLLHRRRSDALPGRVGALFGGGRVSAAAEPLVVRVQALTPAARVAVLRFGGRDHLVGFSGEAMLLIASRDAAPGAGEAGS